MFSAPKIAEMTATPEREKPFNFKIFFSFIPPIAITGTEENSAIFFNSSKETDFASFFEKVGKIVPTPK